MNANTRVNFIVVSYGQNYDRSALLMAWLKATRTLGLRQAGRPIWTNNPDRVWYKRHIKRAEQVGSFSSRQHRDLDKQADIGFACKFEEGGRATIFETVDEVGMLEAEQFDRHLAGDEFDFGFLTQLAQVRDSRHAAVGNGHFHQASGDVFVTGNERLDGIGHVPVDALEPLGAKRHLHGHAGIAQRAHFQAGQILADELETIKSEENLDRKSTRLNSSHQ